MEWLTIEQRANLFSTFERDAFHLEMRDEYNVEDEVEPLRNWRNGEWRDPEAAEWWEPWLMKMRNATNAGKRVRRLRIVTEPITDYTRFLWEGTRYNVSAGEDVRWLPRHLVPEGTVFPENDFWLFDESWVAFNYFNEDERSMRMERVTDPSAVELCMRISDRLWPLAVPHNEYKPV
ncbi:MAG: DUF6879 family protein [Carbonactinosporaceae bacterium]